MAKFSERQKQKVKKEKTSINYALGCIALVIIIPIVVFGLFTLNKNNQEARRNERIKTKYQEGLIGVTSRSWVLIGHEFTDLEKLFRFTVLINDESVPKNLEIQYRKVGDKDFMGTMLKAKDGEYYVELAADLFEPQVLELEAVATSPDVVGKKWTSTSAKINVSYPLYVSWTMDWEGFDLSQGYRDQMSRISTDHKNLPITHFFNPRIWTGMSAGQAQFQMDYVKQRRDEFGDEIGVHFHMWYDFVRAAGITARSEPAWNNQGNVSGGGGYDVPFSAYNYEESKQLLEWTKQMFADNGLGTPISFRAGGWFLDLENVKALEETGFKVDSSGRDSKFWGRVSSSENPWSLSSTTKPYKISTENQNDDEPAPRYDVWEIPNNGADSYWFSAQDMIRSVYDNFPNNAPLKERRIVVILSHPHWFNVDYSKLQETFSKSDEIHYSDDKGPLLYTTLANYYNTLATDPNPKYND